MSERIEQFSRVLDRLGFAEPAPPELQEYIRKVKRRQFRKTLKRTGAYSLVFILISYIYFTLKKIGISVTIYKSAAILALGSSITAVSIGAGAYFAAKKIIAPAEEIKIEKIQQEENVTAAVPVPVKKEPDNADTLENIRKRIGVQPFDAANADVSMSVRVTDMIAAGLAALRGADYVVNTRREKSGKRTGMLLKGSVEFLNGEYTLTAKVVDVQTLKVIYYTSETAATENDIDSACSKIAEKIFRLSAVPGTPDMK